MVSDVHTVPLYLIPQVIAADINRYGRAIETIRVNRASGNQYSVNTMVEMEANSDE